MLQFLVFFYTFLHVPHPLTHCCYDSLPLLFFFFFFHEKGIGNILIKSSRLVKNVNIKYLNEQSVRHLDFIYSRINLFTFQSKFFNNKMFSKILKFSNKNKKKPHPSVTVPGCVVYYGVLVSTSLLISSN